MSDSDLISHYDHFREMYINRFINAGVDALYHEIYGGPVTMTPAKIGNDIFLKCREEITKSDITDIILKYRGEDIKKCMDDLSSLKDSNIPQASTASVIYNILIEQEEKSDEWLRKARGK